MRNSISGRLAGTALAAALLTASLGAGAGVSPAQAASCSSWSIPGTMKLSQSNGWTVHVTKRSGVATAYGPDHAMFSEDVEFTTFAGSRLRFIVTWRDGAAGVYEGRIDGDGFVSGTTRDRWNSSSKATWSMRGRASCAR